MDIRNTEVYGLYESIFKSGYAMLPKMDFSFDDEVKQIKKDHISNIPNKHIQRAIKLASSPNNSGHANYMKSIVVQMDVEAPSYVWPQIQRYQFFTIISSQSKMHRLKDMNLKLIPDVGNDIIQICEENLADYEDGLLGFEEVLAEVPMGLELTAGISTNYLCLKNMFNQRKNHKLKFWTEIFVPWIKTLPMSKELIIGES